ncbi:MAG: hypothetical protein M1832_006424 [Thelocarpon impressellum]|nr:MAG: hypothetical protein M1832_006424 [Thelocarpon impressellum]
MTPTKLSPEELRINRGGHVLGAIIPLTALSLIAVCLRLVSRRMTRARLWWDDYTIIFAMVLNLADLAISILGVHAGLGKHGAVVPKENVVFYVKTIYGFEMVYTLTIMTTKLSILLFYHRVFASKRFQQVLKGFMIFVTLWGIMMTLIVVGQCTPPAHFWQPKKTPGKCINLVRFFVGSAIPNIITDFMIVILPMPLIWRMQLKLEQKITLTAIFALAGFTCVASVVRVIFLGHEGFIEPTWTNVLPKIWTVFETCCGIIVACLPTMRPLLSLMMGRSIEASRATPRNDSGIATIGGSGGKRSGGSKGSKSPWSSKTDETTTTEGGSFVQLRTTTSNGSAQDVEAAMDDKHFGTHTTTRNIAD